jgi:inner membrane protein
MPSPIGHALAGCAAAWAIDLVPGDRAWRTAPATASWYERAGDGLTVVCGGLGVAADVDLLFGGHRTLTHSLGAVFVVGLVAGLMAANARRPVARIALMSAAAYATHVLLDWLGADQSAPYGVRALWPFSTRWYISGLDIFRETARRFLITRPVIEQNAVAIVQEIAILGPVLVALWSVRVKALAGLATELPRCDHAAQ